MENSKSPKEEVSPIKIAITWMPPESKKHDLWEVAGTMPRLPGEMWTHQRSTYSRSLNVVGNTTPVWNTHWDRRKRGYTLVCSFSQVRFPTNGFSLMEPKVHDRDQCGGNIGDGAKDQQQTSAWKASVPASLSCYHFQTSAYRCLCFSFNLILSFCSLWA